MELLRLRKRLVLARRGHKLLQDKLEELMRRFMVLLRDIDAAEIDFQKRTAKLLKDLLYCRISTSREDFQNSLNKIEAKIDLAISTARILNVKVPQFTIRQIKIDKHYDFFKTSGQLDLVVSEAKGYLESLLKLAQMLKTAEVLSAEIERTRRRVNALEYILIPSIVDTARFIVQKLNEFERGNLVRLMRVKEIVRAH
jgi:V/A-type H+-transporting ATPase subunit D